MCLLYHLLDFALAEHEVEGGIATESRLVALERLFTRQILLLLLLQYLQLTWRQHLLEGLEELIPPLLLFLLFLLPEFGLLVLLGYVHMKIHTLILKAPYNNIAKLVALNKCGQINVYLIEPVNFLPFSEEGLDEDFVYVIGFLNHCVEALLSDLVTDALLPLIHVLGLFDECQQLTLAFV